MATNDKACKMVTFIYNCCMMSRQGNTPSSHEHTHTHAHTGFGSTFLKHTAKVYQNPRVLCVFSSIILRITSFYCFWNDIFLLPVYYLDIKIFQKRLSWNNVMFTTTSWIVLMDFWDFMSGLLHIADNK